MEKCLEIEKSDTSKYPDVYGPHHEVAGQSDDFFKNCLFAVGQNTGSPVRPILSATTAGTGSGKSAVVPCISVNNYSGT